MEKLLGFASTALLGGGAAGLFRFVLAGLIYRGNFARLCFPLPSPLAELLASFIHSFKKKKKIEKKGGV